MTLQFLLAVHLAASDNRLELEGIFVTFILVVEFTTG